MADKMFPSMTKHQCWDGEDTKKWDLQTIFWKRWFKRNLSDCVWKDKERPSADRFVWQLQRAPVGSDPCFCPNLPDHSESASDLSTWLCLHLYCLKCAENHRQCYKLLDFWWHPLVCNFWFWVAAIIKYRCWCWTWGDGWQTNIINGAMKIIGVKRIWYEMDITENGSICINDCRRFCGHGINLIRDVLEKLTLPPCRTWTPVWWRLSSGNSALDPHLDSLRLVNCPTRWSLLLLIRYWSRSQPR